MELLDCVAAKFHEEPGVFKLLVRHTHTQTHTRIHTINGHIDYMQTHSCGALEH